MRFLFYCIFSLCTTISAFAQFSDEDVMVFVKAGENMESAKCKIIVHSPSTQMFMVYDSYVGRCKREYKKHSEYFKNPLMFPNIGSHDLSTSYDGVKNHSFNHSISNGKWFVYSGTTRGVTKYYAISTDKSKMIAWQGGNEDSRVIYLRVDIASQSNNNSNYEFLE